MTQRILTLAAGLLLGASAAAAQGISTSGPMPVGPSPANVPAPVVVATEPFMSMLIVETVTPPPPSAPPSPSAKSVAAAYIGPGLTLFAPTPADETNSAHVVPNVYAAIDAGPTFIPPAASSYVLRPPSYDRPGR